MRQRPRPLAGALLIAGLCVTAAHAQLVGLGGEFQANSFTTNGQSGSAVAVHADGSFVVVWTSYGSASDPSGHSVQGQRYDGAGAPLGAQFQANTLTTGTQTSPAVAADASGGFVVVWSSDASAGSDTDAGSIQARRYDAAGAPIGAEFQVNAYTTGFQGSPAVAADGSGRFAVVWNASDGDGSDTDSLSIHGRRFDAGGAPLGGEFQVNSYTTGAQSRPSVAAAPDGTLLVVWGSEGSADSDSSGDSIHGQRYDSAGAPVGSEFQVNSYTTSYQMVPDVAATGSGTFVVVWHSLGGSGSDTSNYSIQGQRYDAANAASGGEFQVNVYPTGSQNDPAVVGDGVGNFVVVWGSAGSAGRDTSASSVQARRFTATGAPIDAEFQVNSYTTNAQDTPAVASDGAGGFIVAWVGSGSAQTDTAPTSVQGQRYALGRPVRGKKLLLKNPTGLESDRTVVISGRETATDVGPAITGDPVALGGILRLIAKGTMPSDHTFVLDAAGWRAIGTGFKYSGPTGGDGDPVRKVLISRSPGGTARIKAILKGNLGTQSLLAVPPDNGDEGGIILTLNGGGTYCAAFGGTAGGTEDKDTAQLWKVRNAVADGCPSP
jgi:hypothetical protein